MKGSEEEEVKIYEDGHGVIASLKTFFLDENYCTFRAIISKSCCPDYPIKRRLLPIYLHNPPTKRRRPRLQRLSPSC